MAIFWHGGAGGTPLVVVRIMDIYTD